MIVKGAYTFWSYETREIIIQLTYFALKHIMLDFLKGSYFPINFFLFVYFKLFFTLLVRYHLRSVFKGISEISIINQCD